MPADASDRLLLVTLSNIGDLVMTTPVLEALHRQYPAHRIDCLGDARSCVLLSHAPYLGEIFEREKRAGPRAQFGLVRRLRRRRYDAIVDLRTPVIPFLLRGDRRLVKRRHDVPGLHAVEEHFAVVSPLLPKGSPLPATRLYPGDAARSAASQLLSGSPGQRWLAVAPGANWPGKKWPCAAYRELLDSLTQFDAVVVLGGTEDRAEAALLEHANLPVENLAGQTDLLLAAALLERAAAFIGNDSGLGHMAAAVGTPTLTVFGPGRPARYRPWGDRARIVEAPGGRLDALSPGVVAAALAGLPSREAD